jgi:hypothetical protein
MTGMFERAFQMCPFFANKIQEGAGHMNWIRKHKKSIIIYTCIVAASVLLNIIAWNSNAFCDWYIKYIFPIWVNTYGRVTGWVPFSVGEILLLLAVILVVVWVLLLLLSLLVKVIKLCSTSDKEPSKWTKAFGRFVYAYSMGGVWILAVVGLIMTLNCFILYHASTFSERYYGETKESYSLEELILVRNHVVECCNQLAKEMDRDEYGNIIYHKDIPQEAIKAMQNLGQFYDQLDGFYPRPKPLAASDFFSQQYSCGYYFPFTMEANYNDVMYIMNWPFAICHELAHLRGYIYEDEANMIGYLACIQSGDPVFEYSGYLSVLYYLDNDLFDALGDNWDVYFAQPQIDEQVHIDNVFLQQEDWDRIEEEAVFETEVVDAVSDTFTDTVLVVNGVEDGIKSYSRVVQLLLLYYEKEGLE